MSQSYEPIDCGLHDELQLRVLRRRPVEVIWVDPSGERQQRTDRVVDVFSRDGSEYLRLQDGAEIRLDRLQRVDGLPFGTLPS